MSAENIFRGRVWKFGDDVDTDSIIPVQHTVGTDTREFGRYCMAGLDPFFAQKVGEGDIIVAGRNFGCGSSREPAPLAIKAAGVACVIACSFARIFYRNAFNVGLPLLECPEVNSIEEGHEVEVQFATGEIKELCCSGLYQARPIPSFMQDLLSAGGLMQYVARRLGL